MYIPEAYRETDVAKLHALMQEHSFATLVSQHDGGTMATHLPLLVDPGRSPAGTLRGHVARANAQWTSLEGQEVLAIFHGPHAYVSPSWYAADQAVPTWNYVAVHAYGVPRLLNDSSELSALLRDMVEVYEEPLAEPWQLDATSAFISSLMRGIVGFEIEITRLEGKLKLSQNRSVADREGAIHGLRQRGTSMEREVATLMELGGS
jgi:transcriptional regulator